MTFRIAILVFFAGSMGLAAPVDEPINVGSRLELFVDDYLIDRMTTAVLELQHPTPRELSMVYDKPWEGNDCTYHTVFQDVELYRMYYRGNNWDPKTGQSSGECVCYAQSTDGISWERPELGLEEFVGSKKNNIIWKGYGSHNFAPFRDPNPKCKPDEKYKALGGGPLKAFKSPDGIHWSLMQEEPVITNGDFDSQNLAFWDSVRGRYVDFHRKSRDGYRDIMTCTSDDFLHWSEPVFLEYPGSLKEHLYTNQITPYCRAPHLFFGFPKRFLPSRSVLPDHLPGVSDGLLMTSRDGLHFKRWGEAFIRPGLQRERWGHRNNLTAWGIVATKSDIPNAPEELSIYSTENYNFAMTEPSRLRRFTLRVDGFVSVRAPLAGGEMVTKPIVFEGKELVINFSTSAAGSVRVEIQDAEGQPVPGYELAESVEIFGDQIERVVAWKGGSNASQLAGKPVRLRFVIKDADLYSMRFR